MVASSPLGRFFKVAASPASKDCAQSTPAPNGAGASPPSTDAKTGAKRAAAAVQDAEAAAKKPRPAGAGAEDRGPAHDASSVDAAQARASEQGQPGGGAAVPAPALSPPSAEGAPTDLRAALQQAQRGGSLPPFTAECFHHYSMSLTHYSWPSWLQPSNLRDKRGVKPGEPGFDQGSLWIPSEKVQKDEGHGTPMLLQFWKVKNSHFDKVALFKVGKFYEVFYYDAFIAQHVCNLKWMAGEKKPHVGFPEMAKHDYAKKLVDAGYKVVVVEQVERVQENKQRTADAKQSGPTCIEREACEVFTKGTVVDPEMIGGSDARFLACLHFEEGQSHGSDAGARNDKTFSACLVDCATSQISVARVPDGTDRNALRTLLAQVQPSEVVYAAENLPGEVAGLLRRLPCRPQISALRCGQLNPLLVKERMDKYRAAQPGKFGPDVEACLAEHGGSAAVAVAGALEYLGEVLLSNRVLPFAVWSVLDLPCAPAAHAAASPAGERDASNANTVGKRMMLDATALSALEILETLEGTYKGSLLEFLDHTKTPFGFRLLKQWLCAPLLDLSEIRSRCEAVEFLMKQPDLAGNLRSGLKKVEVDLERATSRVWGYALQTERHAVMYEDITARRLRDFSELLRAYEKCRALVASVPSGSKLPKRLMQITRTRKEGGSFPDLKEVIDRLSGSVVTAPSKNNTVKYRPRDGADPRYDAIKKEIDDVKACLDKELEVTKKKLPGVPVTFVHRQPGYRYEIEAEDGSVSEDFLLKQVELTSRLKNKVRFQTVGIKKLLTQLDRLEDQLEDCIWPFLSSLFQDFYAHQAQFRAAARIVAELDALLSLAAASQGLAGSSCQAEFVPLEDPSQNGTLELRGCQHPVAAAKMGASFVPNDTLLNAGGVPGVLVVTGPNMGGKSTVLRQTCIAVVMAQLGCRVNATSCRMSPVDRIFTRIGSYDTILEGKSTLLTELEETAAVLAHGSRRSLAVLDELGRGTSTFDGAAIAAAVLEDLATRVGCMALFATHYHPVSHEAAQWKQVAPFHMAATLNEETQEMTFLYRFLPGLCPASHGHNVARLAGLPKSVLEEAVRRSTEFERGNGIVEGAAKDEDVKTALGRFAQAADEAGLRALFRQRQLQPQAAR